MRIIFPGIVLFPAAALLLCLLFSGCTGMNVIDERGSGKVISDQHSIRGVSRVSLATLGHMVIELGDAESLRIEAEDNLLRYLKTEVNNCELTIKSQYPVNFFNTKPVHYYLTVKSLDSIAVYSSGDIVAPDLKADHFSITVASTGSLDIGALEAGALKVAISSSGDVRMRALNADSLDVNLSSSGDLEIAGGEVKTQTVVLSSSGDYKARSLASDEASVQLNSIGSATIRVRSRLNANLNSSGDLNYIGNPLVNINRNSAGDVNRIGN